MEPTCGHCLRLGPADFVQYAAQLAGRRYRELCMAGINGDSADEAQLAYGGEAFLRRLAEALGARHGA